MGGNPVDLESLVQSCWIFILKLSGLIALRNLVKNYEFQLERERASLAILIQHFFSRLKEIVDESLKKEDPTTLNEALKIYWISTHLDVDPFLAQKTILENWLSTFKLILEKNLGNLSNSLQENEDEEQRGSHPWWQAKKQISQVVHRFLMRYGSAGHTEGYKQ